MVELLAHADPLNALLAVLWLFAAGMFPVGFMLGSQCSPCCGCSACTQGQLPDTLTVTFNGLADKTQGPDLITLSFSSCYGTGAVANVTAPGGDPATDKGPIGTVSLTSGGSGYARLGRVAPTLTVSGGSGTGATFTPTLDTSQDGCKLDLWALKSVAVTGGKDYVDGESLTITVATGDTDEQSATAVVRTQREEPTLTLDGTATATIDYTDLGGGSWSVASLTITNGGSGYIDGDALSFTLGSGDVQVSAANVIARTNRLEPTLDVYVYNSAGTGASLTPTLNPTTGFDGRDVWEIASLAISAAGSGYSVGDYIFATVTAGQSDGIEFIATVASINGSGGITGVTITQGGLYFLSGDVLVGADIASGGLYYKDTGEMASVEVTGGGVYYREDASVAPYVADVTVSISQAAPSAGSGAILSVEIDDDTGSATFGQIAALNIDDGGDDYLAWQWRNSPCCGSYYNGMSVVVKRDNHSIGILNLSEPCRYIHRMCGVGNRETDLGYVMVEYLGASTPPVVYLVSESNIQRSGIVSGDSNPSGVCNTTFTTEQLVSDCSNWTDGSGDPILFEAIGGATASVAVGGAYDAAFRDAGGRSCHICCKGDEAPPLEVEVTFDDPRPVKTGGDRSGTYVLSIASASNVPTLFLGGWLGPALRWTGSFNNSGFVLINVLLEPCSNQYEQSATPPFRSGTSFVPDASGCDHCHNKCRVWAWVSFGFGLFDCAWQSDTSCVTCEDTPICSPQGRTLEMPNAGCQQLTLTVA